MWGKIEVRVSVSVSVFKAKLVWGIKSGLG